MAYRQEVKELAYTLDPECWLSYSGKPRAIKRVMDARRTKSLQEAERRLPPPFEYDNTQEEITILRDEGLISPRVADLLEKFDDRLSKLEN